MSAFEFVFSLIGLVLGLSFVEVLGGLVRALKSGVVRRTNILTLMLGLWVLLDVTSFWGMVWGVRDHIEALRSIWPVLGAGALITSVYYVAASLVFPDHSDRDADFAAHYWRRKRTVVGLVWFCELAAMGCSLAFLGSGGWPLLTWLINAIVLSGAALLWWSRNGRVDVAVLGILIANGVWTFSY